jgi:hypothetical protein
MNGRAGPQLVFKLMFKRWGWWRRRMDVLEIWGLTRDGGNWAFAVDDLEIELLEGNEDGEVEGWEGDGKVVDPLENWREVRGEDWTFGVDDLEVELSDDGVEERRGEL